MFPLLLITEEVKNTTCNSLITMFTTSWRNLIKIGWSELYKILSFFIQKAVSHVNHSDISLAPFWKRFLQVNNFMMLRDLIQDFHLYSKNCCSLTHETRIKDAVNMEDLTCLLATVRTLIKFSALIPKISCIAYSHFLTYGSVLHHQTKYRLKMLVSDLLGHLSNYKRWISLVVGCLGRLLSCRRSRRILFPSRFCFCFCYFFCFWQHVFFTYFPTSDLTKLGHSDRYLDHYSRTNNDGVRCQDGVTGVKKVIFTKKASSPTEYLASMRDLFICISLTPSKKVMVLKIHPGSFGVTGVKRQFSLKML